MQSRESLSNQRIVEKQLSRAEDERRLSAGEVSPDQLRRENSFFNLNAGVRVLDFGAPSRRRK